MRISDWSSDVCSSDLTRWWITPWAACSTSSASTPARCGAGARTRALEKERCGRSGAEARDARRPCRHLSIVLLGLDPRIQGHRSKSEEHTSELQSLMSSSYAVFCLTKKKNTGVRQ